MIVLADIKMVYSWLCVCLTFCATCCFSWPTNYNQLYDNNYISPAVLAELTDPEIYSNPWEIAQEPVVYEPSPGDYYMDPQFTDDSLADTIQEYEESYQPKSIYGKVILEKPETELEELKELTFKNRNEKRGVSSNAATTMRPHQSSTHPPVLDFNEQVVAETKKVNPLHGQLETPLLRPPNKPTPEESEPITLTQVSAEKRLSPYDKLRKLVSMEDALKKKANERKMENNARHVKRNFITDDDSLTGQLSKLKKTLN